MKSATMKSAALHSAAVEPTSDARLPTGRKAPRHPAMVEPAERTRTSAGLEVLRFWSVEPGAAMKVRATVGPRGPMKVRATVESWAAAVEVVAIDEGAAVRDVSV